MTLLKKIIRQVTPPIVLRLLGYSRLNKKIKKEERTIREIEEMGPIILSLCFGVPLFSVPVEKLRYYGGLLFDAEHHHFLKYYKQGKKALADFYDSHQPKNIFEKHFMPVPQNYYKFDLDKIEKEKSIRPWLFNVNNIEFDGEKGLGNEQGNQAYGPATNEKIELEAKRLDRVLNSIKKTGFKPLQFDGYPRGYFLMDKKDNWSFLVRTGYHRVAALIHLGYKRIPFEFQHQHPRIVYEITCREWASVREGYLSEKDAVSIFKRYVT